MEVKNARWDGEDVSPALLGRAHTSRRAPIFWRRPPDRKTATMKLKERLPDLAMREGDWKLLCEYDGTKPQLYDLAADCTESNNRAAEKPEIVARMTQALLEWHADMPADRGPELGKQP